jgi:hypothetical protein
MQRWMALVLAFTAGALGCSGRETSGRARLWTLIDVAAALDADPSATIAGVSASYLLKPSADHPGSYELAGSHGFIEGRPATYMTTEVWENVDEIWVQPLYRAINADGTVLDDPDVREPWIFGVGPNSLFYSPFWQVYGFQLPDGVNVVDVLDQRAVLDAAKKTGGLRKMERRITPAAPSSVLPPGAWTENIYFDNTAAWDGTGDRRYIDFGPGRFDFDETGVLREVPIFAFRKRNADGDMVPFGTTNVGGTRPLFSGAPSISNAADAGAPTPDLNPNFGGLWRMYTVDVPDGVGLAEDGRVVTNPSCLDGSGPCNVLDSQSAVESLGVPRIHRTNVLLTCPLVQLGDVTFPRMQEIPPKPAPTTP